MKTIKISTVIICVMLLNSCNSKPSHKDGTSQNIALLITPPEGITAPEGMIWVPGKVFIQGAKPNDPMAMPREKPGHNVLVDGFFMDATEVTNAQFEKFIEATNYVTVAERPIDWEEMKKELPEGTPKPPDSVLQPGSLVFNKDVEAVVNMNNYGQWWTWKIGANWKQPDGPGSSIVGKEDYPVVHVAYEDAIAYCKWANRKLPTEAQWESAAQGKEADKIFTWGNDISQLSSQTNTWEGTFPTTNTGVDGFKYIAPIKSFPPNDLGFYEMAGNVWEWTTDLYNHDYYKQLDTTKPIINPTGASTYFNPQSPYQIEMIMKGGSYLCHSSYCASFRISARMSTSKDSGSDHLGFRTIASIDMLK
ncbi:sulfatase [Nonlabens ulvanivorans]|uniref:Sulfatase n=2 Tax=Nonlabens ulvanivorans TaxID=906888 RepID=A0A084JZ97_NONUL|nr:sulfatase [Nonlabens ulvanivorans]